MKKTWFNDILKKWKEAGISPVFASGNEISGKAEAGSIDNPASLIGALSVGSVDKNYELSKFSRRGPSLFDPDGKYFKPELVAPGQDIRAAINNNRYGYMYGTSISSPQVAGVIALIKEKNPNLSPDEIEDILIKTARGLTDEEYKESPNMGYGYGIVDAEKAILSLDSPKEDPEENTRRISGNDRKETALAISKKYFSTEKAVYLTGANSSVDALVSSPLNKSVTGPLLLTDRDELSKDVLDEIKRLGAEKVVVIGGENTISEKVFNELKDSTGEVIRLSGSDRYETSRKIGQSVIDENESNSVFFVNGQKEVDAVALAGASIKNSLPIVLVGGENLDKNTLDFIKKNKIEKVILVGGEGSLSSELEKDLVSLNIDTKRIGGENRFQTASLIASEYFNSPEGAFVASGENIVDALTIGPVSAIKSYPVVLTSRDNLPHESLLYIKEENIEEIIILGGENSVSKAIEEF